MEKRKEKLAGQKRSKPNGKVSKDKSEVEKKRKEDTQQVAKKVTTEAE